MAGRRIRVAMVCLVVAWAGVIGGLAWFLLASPASSRSALNQRLEERAGLAEFASLYVGDLIARERAAASSWLAGATVSSERFDRTVAGLGLAGALLLDQRGIVQHIRPAIPGMLGTGLTRHNAYRRGVLAGRVAVSGFGPSGLRGVSIVALAIRFRTASGYRVFSVGYQVSQTPQGKYLDRMIATPGHQVYLVDAAGAVIAGSKVGAGRSKPLPDVDPSLARAAVGARSGAYGSPEGSQEFVRAAVPGIRWQILVREPQAELYSSVNGTGRWLGWAVLTGFALAGLGAIVLIGRLNRSRRRLDQLAHLDVLTGLKNRRALEQTLQMTLSAARRGGGPRDRTAGAADHRSPALGGVQRLARDRQPAA